MAKVVGLAFSSPALVTLVPVPVTDSVVVEGWASLVKVSVALAAPAACGLNVTENGTLCPSAIVTGNEIPLKVKAVLSELPAVTVTLPPLALSVPDAVPLLPINTLPSPKGDGLTESCVGGGAVLLPVPVNEMVKEESEALLLIATEALNVAEALGVKVMLIVELLPASIVSGREVEARAKYLVEKLTLLIVSDAEPELVAVSETALLLPTTTVPKFNELLLRVREPFCVGPPDWLPLDTPAQPTRANSAGTRMQVAIVFTYGCRATPARHGLTSDPGHSFRVRGAVFT